MNGMRSVHCELRISVLVVFHSVGSSLLRGSNSGAGDSASVPGLVIFSASQFVFHCGCFDGDVLCLAQGSELR